MSGRRSRFGLLPAELRDPFACESERLDGACANIILQPIGCRPFLTPIGYRIMLGLGDIMTLRISRPEDIGALVRDRRHAIGLSQTDLGLRLNVSRKWISELERGKATAHLGLVLEALKALGVALAADHEGLSDAPIPSVQRGSGKRPPISIKDIVDG